jgi:hypothetical protein
LNAAKERTRTGKTVWDRATVGDMLHNPARHRVRRIRQNARGAITSTTASATGTTDATPPSRFQPGYASGNMDEYSCACTGRGGTF